MNSYQRRVPHDVESKIVFFTVTLHVRILVGNIKDAGIFRDTSGQALVACSHAGVYPRVQKVLWAVCSALRRYLNKIKTGGRFRGCSKKGHADSL